MLNFAPGLIADELLYSYAARWLLLSGLKRSTFCEAVAGRQVAFHALNAARFVALDSTAGILADKSWVEENMTLYPFARPFLGEEINARHFTTGKELKRVGTEVDELRRRPWSTLCLNHCPECARENRLSDGVAAWRRSHNLPGVTACLKHGCRLFTTSRTPGALKMLKVEPHQEIHLGASYEEIWYAATANELLGASIPVVHREQFRYALQAGLARTFGRTDSEKMEQMIRLRLTQEFEPGFLRRIGVGTESAQMAAARIMEHDAGTLNPVHAILVAKLTHEGGIIELFKEALTLKVRPMSNARVAKMEIHQKRVESMEAFKRRCNERRTAELSHQLRKDLALDEVILLGDEG
ncbi:TniQ family protein [Roseateles sp.]|uniref:TniQ family protein n=1 Tax=Roseateles sp. TaxID=1971397 RepID=UPI003D0BACF7